MRKKSEVDFYDRKSQVYTIEFSTVNHVATACGEGERIIDLNQGGHYANYAN